MECANWFNGFVSIRNSFGFKVQLQQLSGFFPAIGMIFAFGGKVSILWSTSSFSNSF